jgi:alpha-tubulin suppressor-like RCC1 family protein
VAIAAGLTHTCALTSAGGVLCWGYNGNGQLGNDSTTSSLVPVAVTGLSSGVASLAPGSYATHTCAVTTAGKGLCWGNDADDQLGDGLGLSESVVPVAVAEP